MTTLCLSCKQYRNVDSTNMSCCCQKILKIGHNQMGNLREMHWNFPKTMNFYLAMIFVNFLIIYSPFLIEISKPLHGFFGWSHV